MNVLEILEDLSRRGVKVWPDGETIRYRARKGTLTDDDKLTLHRLRGEVLDCLVGREGTSPGEVADNVEACLHLGQRLQRGEIKAVLCGLTGHRCPHCHGVPCLGSEPWVDPR